MTTYELYINNILCDLSSDEVITLLYQSPIFSELDSIQSNRSYNIALLPTPTNMRAIGHAARVDVDSGAPYVRLPAALYQDGVPLFTQGFAVVTDIADTINVTLTWGNVDNFQPLFDSSLRELGPQFKEEGEEHIAWNENTAILEASATGKYPGVAFWGVDFGMGLSNPKYLHPSVQVKTILSAIEKYNGITIDGKERLAYSKNLGPIIPLVSKNGDEVSGKAETTRCSPNPKDVDGYTLLVGDTTYFNEHSEYIEGNGFNVKGADYVAINIQFHGVAGNGSGDKINKVKVYVCDGSNYNTLLAEIPSKPSITGSNSLKIDINTDVVLSKELGNIPASGYMSIVIVQDKTGSWVISNPYIMTLTAYPRENVNFPSIFPIAPNLPDMSQGDFILALMNMNGLFAYADKDGPNTIKLISIDDVIANVQNSNIVDWSGKVILNDFHRVDMPGSSAFTIENLAQSNILDYDNDSEVAADTHGVITVRNENIEKETELVELPFSASHNGDSLEGVYCAWIPIYKDRGDGKVDYSGCSPRILSGRGTFMSGIVRCIGVFDPWMKFGGDEGIVKTKYASYQKVVDRPRIISIRAKLSALDLYNLDYTKPVYIAQFGQMFAIYSVETGEDGICDCQLLKLKADGITPPTYYITLNGATEGDVVVSVEPTAQRVRVSYQTNGTLQLSSSGDAISTSEIDDAYILVYTKTNPTSELRTGVVAVTLEEAPLIRRNIVIRQAGIISYNPSVSFSPSLPWEASVSSITMTNTGNVDLEITAFPGWFGGANLPYTLTQGANVNILFSPNTSSQARTGIIEMHYTDEKPGSNVDYNVEVSQRGVSDRMVIIDTSIDPSMKGQSVMIYLLLLTDGAYGELEVKVSDDNDIRLTFKQIADSFGYPNLEDYAGDTLRIDMPDNGIFGEAQIPATGDVHIVLK